MTVAAGPQRPIPTVQASPALLREGDMIYPDAPGGPWDGPYRVRQKPHRENDGRWRIDLWGAVSLWVPTDGKVRTQRRPNPGPPTPDAAWDAAADSYRIVAR